MTPVICEPILTLAPVCAVTAPVAETLCTMVRTAAASVMRFDTAGPWLRCETAHTSAATTSTPAMARLMVSRRRRFAARTRAASRPVVVAVASLISQHPSWPSARASPTPRG